MKLIAALTRRLRETNERIARQSFQTVPSRVAGVLFAADRRGGDLRGAERGHVRMTQADLAQLAGTSRESVSRFLATLERAGVVRGRPRTGDGPRAAAVAGVHLLAGRMPAISTAARARWSSASCAAAGSRDERVLGGDGRGPARAVRRRRTSAGAPTPTAALPIGDEQTISQPWIVAAICQGLGAARRRAGARSRHRDPATRPPCSPSSPPR